MKRSILLTLTLPASLALASCVSFGSKAPPQLLVLTASTVVPSGTAKTGAAKDALVVLIPNTPRKIDTVRVPVQIDESSIAYLKDASWADKPARLMQDLLAETISAKTNQFVLNEPDTLGKAERFLSGELTEFGIDGSTQEAVVVYDAVKLVRGQAVDTRRFEAREPVAAVEPVYAGSALNKAANRVAADVAAWMGG